MFSGTVNVNLENIIAEVDICMSEGKQKPDLNPYFSDARKSVFLNEKETFLLFK